MKILLLKLIHIQFDPKVRIIETKKILYSVVEFSKNTKKIKGVHSTMIRYL